MENVYEQINDGNVYEKPRERPDSPAEPKYENQGQGAVYETPGEVNEPLYSEVQVHTSEDGERSSPDYMDTRDGKEDEDKHSDKHSSSSSDDEEEKPEVKEKVEEPQLEVEAVAAAVEDAHQEVNGEGVVSRRSSASSAPESTGDACDDPPIEQEENNTEDGMLMAFKHTEEAPETEEAIDYSLKTLENVNLDENSAAPADPNQPEISLFVKVRNVYNGIGYY